MTPEQQALIDQFKALNAESSSIDGYDQSQIERSTELYNQLKKLGRKLQASGLQVNDVGEWVTPSASTYDFVTD